MMEREDTTSITCSTEELNEVSWFLKMNFWNYAHAFITACEPRTGRKLYFKFHFVNDYASLQAQTMKDSPCSLILMVPVRNR
jgi:hypothetical protein